MNALKFLARSPITWLTIALGALFMAPTAAFAQDIIVLTPANPTANGQIVGNKGIASHIYQIDYVAGTGVGVRVTPTDRAQWWPLTINRQARSRNGGLWAEIWGPTGRINRADFRKRMSSSCTPAQAKVDGTCITFSSSSALVELPLAGPFMVKVNATAPISMPYTVEARGLGAPRATNAGAPAGGVGPEISGRNAQTGSLTGQRTGASVFYTALHPGGGRISAGGAQTQFQLTVYPRPTVADRSKLGINYYRGTTLVGSQAAVGVSGDSPGLDSTVVDSIANHLDYSLSYRSSNVELLTVEIFNYTDGKTFWYSVQPAAD